MSKILILILSTILLNFTSICSSSTHTNGGFFLLLNKTNGIDWNKNKIAQLGVLSTKVFKNFENLFNSEKYNNTFPVLVKKFNEIATSEHGSPRKSYLLKLIESSKADLTSSVFEVKKKAVEKYRKILLNMGEIASSDKYDKFVEEVKDVFDFTSDNNGKFKNYDAEIQKLKDQLVGSEKGIIKKSDPNEVLRKLVLKFLENKFLYVVLEFTENCPMKLKFDSSKKEYIKFEIYSNTEIRKKCLENYYGKLYNLLNKGAKDGKWEGKKMFDRVNSEFTPSGSSLKK